MNPRRRAAFTLIELLIVVAIIAILAAIATVNFLEAQTRSKVARVRTDVRTLQTALEAYRTDNSAYPHAAIGDLQLDLPLVPLTTPVAYITTVPRDPFGPAPFDFAPQLVLHGYNYKDRASTSINMPAETYGDVWRVPELAHKHYMIHSCGPNLVWDVTPYVEYDPTNGTTSMGDITTFGPG